jgi:hypothetical protein
MSSPRLFLASPYVGVQLLNLDFGKAGTPGYFLAGVPDPCFGIAINAGQNGLMQVFVLQLAVFVFVEELPTLC